MDKYKEIQKAITVYVPGHLCNLRCSYCYVTECLKEGHLDSPSFPYSVEHMVAAFHPDRIGGIAYFTVIGGGETLLPPQIVPFVHGLLRQGHVVEVVTNNTLDDRIDELLDMPQEDRGRLIVKCSLHWTELVRLNKVDSYFANIRKVIAAGGSSYPFMVICDEYVEKLDEICAICEREIGALPQCTPCVIAEEREDFLRGGAAVTQPPCTPEFIKEMDDKLHSRLFTESVRFLQIDPQKVFCYAGKWAFGVHMDSGIVVKCHNIRTKYNFFENIEEPFEDDYVGCECGVANCGLQYPLFGLGMIPEVPNVPTYAEMICDREGLFQEEVIRLMDTKICRGERILTEAERIEFLMNKIVEKNAIIDKMANMINIMKQHQVKKEIVEELLALVESNKLSYNDLQCITYEHLAETYKVCVAMERGQQIFQGILEKIYSGLMASHDFEGINVLYDSMAGCAIWKGIRNLSITSMVVDDGNIEEMQDSLVQKDSRNLALLYQRQLEKWKDM